MTREDVRSRIEQIGIIPAVRALSLEDALFGVDAVSEGGIPIVEVTMTTPGALSLIRQLVQSGPELVVGAGSVCDAETAHRCIDTGAQFITSPGPDVETVEFASRSNVVVFPGAMTPGEIMASRKAGADFVKVFPCALLGGAAFIKAMKAPFPDVRFIAAGGVTQQTAPEFIKAGAVAVGVGHDLIYPEAVRRRDKHWIRELARRFLLLVSEARGVAVAPV